MRLFPGIRGALVVISVFCFPPDSTAQFVIETVVGGKILSGIPANDATIIRPSAIAVDPENRVVFADGSLIRRINRDGTIETIADTGVTGATGDGGPATRATLLAPVSLQFGAEGNLYIADGSNRIRRIDPAGNITTVAGTGVRGTAANTGPATSSLLDDPRGLVVDRAGNLYFSEPGQIRRLTPNGTLEVMARLEDPTCSPYGDGSPNSAASLCRPRSLAVDNRGRIYFVDAFYGPPDFAWRGRIRRIEEDGRIVPIAGHSGGILQEHR